MMDRRCFVAMTRFFMTTAVFVLPGLDELWLDEIDFEEMSFMLLSSDMIVALVESVLVLVYFAAVAVVDIWSDAES